VRIVLALERVPESAAAIDPALALAQSLDATVCALFVENLGLLGYAALPFAQEFDPDSGEARALSAPALERSMRVEAARAERVLTEAARQRSVALSFRVVRGEIDVEARTEGKTGDIVMLGIFAGASRWPPPGRAEPGSRFIAAYYDRSESSARVLDTAARLSEAARHGLAIAAPEGARAEVEALSPARPMAARMAWMGDGGIPAFMQAVARYPVSTYVVSDTFARDMRRARQIFSGGRDYLLVLVA